LAAAAAGDVAGVVMESAPQSFEALVVAERPAWPADAYLTDALQHLDLPELADALACPVQILDARDGEGHPVSPAESPSLGAAVRDLIEQLAQAIEKES